MNSKIEKELAAATGVEPKRGEERQDYLARIITGTGKLPDKDWDKLSEEAQEWYNKAADVQNANSDARKAKGDRATIKDLPDFPDMEEPEPEAPRSRRRGAAAPEDEVAVMKVGSQVTIKTKRGKTVKGEVVELDKEVVVVKTDDGEEEIALDRIDGKEIHHGHKATDSTDDDAGPADPIKVGAEVVLKTKRGKEVSGKIVELDDEVVVLSVDGKDEEFSRDRVDSITPVKAAASGGSSRRGVPASASKADPEPEPAKNKRSTNEPGVSIGTRIKDLIAEDPERSEDDIAKILKKEGIDFKENTLKINYSESQRLIEYLRKYKRMK